MKCDRFIGEPDVGKVGEWDLSSGNLIEHKVHGGAVSCMALSGDRIVIGAINNAIRLFNISTCLLVLHSLYCL